MEFLLLFVVAAVVFFGPIAALIALAEVRSLQRRVQALEAQRRSARGAAPVGADQPTAPPPEEEPHVAAIAPAPPPLAEPELRDERSEPPLPRTRAPLVAQAVELESEEDDVAPPPATEAALALPVPRPHARRRPQLEQWLGVRGAAVVGGLAAAAAALLFFRHAFQHGWITEPLRVGLGLAGGGVLIVAGLLLVRRGYRVAPQALVGAGLTMLDAACWAASRRYELWSTLGSWIAMALVTALAVVLALRLRSQFVAVLGLLGGFATPLVVEAQFDGPWRLFVHVLLLDLGLLAVARRQDWGALRPLALVGTLLLHVVLVARDFDPHDHLALLAILASFAVVFAFSGSPRRDGEESSLASATRAFALLAPLGFALHFAVRADFEPPPWTVGVLGACTTVGAAVLARRREFDWLPWATALCGHAVVQTSLARAGSFSPTFAGLVLGVGLVPALALLGARLLARGLDADACARHRRALALGLVVALFVQLALVLYAALALDGARAAEPRLAFVSLAAAVGVCLVLRPRDFPWAGIPLALSAAAALAATSARVGNLSFARGDWPFAAGATVLVVALFAERARRAAREVLATGASIAAAPAGAAEVDPDAVRPQRVPSAPALAHGATAAAALFSLLCAWPHLEALGSGAVGGLVWVALVALAAVHAAVGSGRLELLAAAALTGTVASSAVGAVADVRPEGDTLRLVAALVAATLVLAGASARAFAARPAAALVAGAGLVVLALVALPTPYETTGDQVLRALPFVVLAALFDLRSARRESPAGRSAALGAAAVLVTAIAIAVDVDREPLALGAGLAAIGWAVLGHRRGATPVQITSACAALVAPLVLVPRLLAPPWHERPAVPIVGELALVHLVPALGAVASLVVLRRRARNGDRDLGILGACAGGAAVVLLVLWTSLEVIAHHTPAGPLRWPSSDAAGVQLALSTSWIAVAVVLLAVGLATRVAGARWASLCVLLAALVKVFVFDLAGLEGLARVGSLAGLAAASISVSLLYQRFVFRRESSPP